MKFSTVREQWWTGQLLDLRDITLYRKSEVIRCHITPYFDNMEIEEITDVHINEYIKTELEHGNRLTNGPLHPGSVRKALQIIRAIMDYAMAKHFINDNPASLVPKIRVSTSSSFKVFSQSEVEALIKVARPKWLGDMILLSYHTGMRKEEVFGLKWSDIDMDNRCLHVNTTIVAISPKTYYINLPKSSSSKRCILFDQSVFDMFMKRQKKSTCNWVFESKYGTEINPWYNVKYFRRACDKANIESGRFHDLRHTHITELVNAGIPLPVVQMRAGHSDINMTMRYTHIVPQMQASVVAFLENR